MCSSPNADLYIPFSYATLAVQRRTRLEFTSKRVIVQISSTSLTAKQNHALPNTWLERCCLLTIALWWQTASDMQLLVDRFSEAATQFSLDINIKKTGCLHQPVKLPTNKNNNNSNIDRQSRRNVPNKMGILIRRNVFVTESSIITESIDVK